MPPKKNSNRTVAKTVPTSVAKFFDTEAVEDRPTRRNKRTVPPTPVNSDQETRKKATSARSTTPRVMKKKQRVNPFVDPIAQLTVNPPVGFEKVERQVRNVGSTEPYNEKDVKTWIMSNEVKFLKSN